jgi:hypothetical protein
MMNLKSDLPHFFFKYKPTILNSENATENELLLELQNTPGIRIIDTYSEQVKDLVRLRNASRAFTAEELHAMAEEYIQQHPGHSNWIYYPWNNCIVRLLREEEFIEVRTNRNKNKITAEEQEILRHKVAGVIGLSVGHAIALTMVTERVCGAIRLADFDTLDLSNLNRIRTGVHNLGTPKVVIAAREIAETDPYIHVEIFPEGITEKNLDAFFVSNNRKLDILVEVCDGLEVKISSRLRAKELGIPVVMDTNDRGMLDVERFDLEPDRPLLHGIVGENVDLKTIKNLTTEEKIPFVLKIVGEDKMSARFRAALDEVKKTLVSWPQLASSVVLGAALCTDTCRRILLNEFHQSGRYYVDIEEQISDNISYH